MEFDFEKYGWIKAMTLNNIVEYRIRRFYTILNLMGLEEYKFHNNNFGLKKRSYNNIIYLINNNGTYIIHSNKIFMIKGDFTYIDSNIDTDFLKIKLVSENLDDIIKLKLFSDKLLREDKLNDLLNS